MKSISAIIIACFLITVNMAHAQCWQQVKAGGGYTVALKSDGTLWAWGRNGEGQLGNGTSGNQVKVPVQVGTDTNWQQVSTGFSHIVAIKSDGTLWTWGYNANGQLGTGTNTDKNAPVQIGTATDWQTVVAGDAHTVAIKNDGSLWAWGNNILGQLGNGTNTEQNAPVQTGTATDWQQVAAEGLSTVALKNNGSLWAWGWNFYGQIGNGTNINSNTPLEINCPSTSTMNNTFPNDFLQLLPNPARDHIIIQTTNITLQDLTFEIRNALGEVIISRQSLTNNQQIDLNDLVQGIYFIIVRNREGQISKPFVKI